MAGVVEVHDKLVAQLHQRNVQLQQEKAECELKLRQATALLSELQAVWMDLPPKVAASIDKLLTSHQHSRPGGVAGCSAAGGQALVRKADKKLQPGWLSFHLEGLFGCTAPRNPDCNPDVGDSPWAPPGRAAHPAGQAAPPRADMMRLDMLSGGDLHENAALDVGDLLCDTPGAVTLVAEIDVLCRALRADSERARRELQSSLEEVREEGRQLRQRLEDGFLRTSAAQDAELQLCKAQLAQLTANANPRFMLAKEPQPELCDAEWAWCQRASEMRARAGQAHVEWIEDCFSQRLSAVQSAIAARHRDITQDLEMIWERKATLAARLRGRLTAEAEAAAGHAAGAGPGRELAQLRKALQDLEASALEPLRVLAAAQGKEAGAEVARLQGAISDARAQCKAASAHLGGLAEQCRAELQARVGSANAALFAQSRMQRRALLEEAFSTWVCQRIALRLGRAEEALLAKRAEATEAATQLMWMRGARETSERRLQRALSGGQAAGFINSCKEGPHLLTACFARWWAQALETQLDAVKLELARNYAETAEYCTQIKALEVERSAGSTQRIRAQRALDAAALSTKHTAALQHALLASAFSAWIVRLLEGRLAATTEELGTHRALACELGTRLTSTEAAVSLAQVRGARRALLAAIMRDWAELWLRGVAVQGAEEVAIQQAHSDEKIEQLRSQVLHLIDNVRSTALASPRCTRRSRHSLGNVSSVTSWDAESLRSNLLGNLKLDIARPSDTFDREQSTTSASGTVDYDRCGSMESLEP